MSDLSIAVGHDLTARIDPIRRAESAAPAPVAGAGAAQESDSVEISDRAHFLSRLRELPAVRADLIQRVRVDLAAGRYDDPEIPSDVIDRIVEDINLLG